MSWGWANGAWCSTVPDSEIISYLVNCDYVQGNPHDRNSLRPVPSLHPSLTSSSQLVALAPRFRASALALLRLDPLVYLVDSDEERERERAHDDDDGCDCA